MADSRTELVIQGIMAALQADGVPDGVTVDRFRKKPVTLADLPRISVYPRDEEVRRVGDSRMSMVTDRLFRFAIVARVEGTDENLDPLRQWIVAAMGAAGSLGGIVLAIDELAVDWEADGDSRTDYSVASTTYGVRYATSKKDLTKAA